jgi:hypothetical protein
MAAQDQIKKLNDQIQELNKQLGGKQIKIFDVNELNEAERVVKSLRQELQEATSDISGLASGFKNVVQEMQKTSKPLADAKKSFNALSGLAQQLQNDQVGINKLSKKELISIQDKIKAEKENQKTLYTNLKQKYDANSITDRELAALVEIEGTLANENVLYNDLLTTARKRLAEEEKIGKTMGIAGAAVDGVGKALDKMGLGGLGKALGLDQVKAKMEEVAAETAKGANYTGGFADKMKVLKGGVKEAGTQFIQSLKDPAAITSLLIKEMVAALQAGDAATGELAKGFNMSYNEASALRKELSVSAAISNDVNVSTKGLQDSMVAIGKTLGSNAKLNEADLITFTKLREQAGYTNEELASIQTLSLANGKSLEDNTAEILGSAEAYASQNKLIINEKDVLREVGKASASLKLSLGGSTAALAESVVKAKQFGLSLEQAGTIAKSLLNFESSISSELEAELLTGKDLNFEKARLLALNGKTADAAAEIAKQVGSSVEFGKMNVIQQEAIAKAAGLTRDELAQSLIESEALAKLSGVEGDNAKEKFDNLVKQVGMEKAKKQLGDDQLANQFAQQSIQERFNKGIEKLRDNLIGIAQPILDILSPLMDIVNWILPAINVLLSPIIEGFRVMGVAVDYIGKGWNWFTEKLEPIMPVLKGIGIAILAIVSPLIMAAAASAFISLAAIPVVGPLLAAAAAIGAISFLTSKLTGIKIKDAVIDPSKGPVMTGEFGSVQLDPNDKAMYGDDGKIKVGTDLMGNKKSTSSSSPSIDFSPLVERINVLINAVNSGGVVLLDGTQVGTIIAPFVATAMAVGTFKTN